MQMTSLTGTREEAMGAKTKRKVNIPFMARRLLSQYEPELRAQIKCEIQHALADKGSDVLTGPEFERAVNDALAAFREIDEIYPDPKMERLSRAASQRGDYLSSEAYLNGLRSELANACAAEASGQESAY
jgi:hypothetical protein